MAQTGAVMTLAVNKSQTLRVGRPIGKMALGSDKIADIVPVSATSVYVLGKAAGATNLSIFDRAGGLIAVVDVVVTPDADSLKRKLAELLPTEAVGVSIASDSLILEGQVSSAAAAERVAAIAQVFAPGKIINAMRVGSPQQVLLEVRFAEMTRSTVKALGLSSIRYSTGAGNDSLGIFPPGNTTRDVFTGSFAFGNLQFQLDALEQQGLVRTLAQPNLIALSGENAYFLAGGEFPIPVASNQVGGITTVTIEFKQFGVSLTFTPTVLEDGLINLVVAPEVSQLDPSAGITLSQINIPGLRVRRARTTLELRDGQAFAMAGLIQSDFQDTVRQIPLLGRLPIFGTLFRSSDYDRTERELVMMVTPRIVRPVAPGALVTPLDRVREPGDFDFFLNGRWEKRVPLPKLPTTPPGGIDGDAGPIVR
ncbi:hypothetical protein IP88_07485 [alpha proteobacterium AAP81b]|nr:hypothetical protein IP88_07485 [alpha proteobacterium AAP81b]